MHSDISKANQVLHDIPYDLSNYQITNDLNTFGLEILQLATH